MFIANEDQWAQTLFGACQLGDQRRTRRLVTYAADQAREAAASTAAVAQGDAARRLGAYRFLHNKKVQPEHLAEAAFDYTLTLAEEAATLLAIEDTTSLAFSHAVRAELGDLGGHFGEYTARGFQMHSVLIVEAETGILYGLAEQYRWQRPKEQRGQKHQRRRRPYEHKESYKWERASGRLGPRLAAHGLQRRVVAVADREADIYEYLQEKTQRQERFVVRAAQDRLLHTRQEKLKAHLQAQPAVGSLQVQVPQRGGRQARPCYLVVRMASVVLKPTSRRGNPKQQRLLEPLAVNVVWAEEEKAPGISPNEQLSWMLLTSEPVQTFEQASQVISYYRRRSLVEEFHKAWKSGCRVEERRLQSAEALERLSVILAFLAVRLLQLRQWEQENPRQPCTTVLTETAWKCLWQSTEKRALPRHTPTVQWAYRAIAQLGGFYDSKRTGRVGWQTLWRGWQRLSERLEGWRQAQEALGLPEDVI